MHAGGAELHPTARLAVVHPEGHVDALDLLQMVGLREGGRQQRLFAIVLLQRLDGVVLIELERKDEIRLQHTGELPRHHGGVAAVRAGGGCRGGVTDQLCTARRAGVCLHALCIRTPVVTQAGGVPVRAVARVCGGLFFRFRRLFCSRLLFLCLLRRLSRLRLFFRVKRLDLGDIKA